MMTYNEAVLFSNHVNGVLQMAGVVMKAACIGQGSEAFAVEQRRVVYEAAKETWLKIYPNSPIKDIL